MRNNSALSLKVYTRRRFLGVFVAGLVSPCLISGCRTTSLTIQTDIDQSREYWFGRVKRFHGEQNPHGVALEIPPDAYPIISDFRSKYGVRGRLRSRSPEIPPQHRGIDIAAPRGTPVISAAAGTVTDTGYVGIGGKYVTVYHGSTFTYYYHLDKILVDKGVDVKRGQIIGLMGNTGSDHKMLPHLHFEVRPARFAFSDNPHHYWFGGPGKITMYRPNLISPNDDPYEARPQKLTYPVPGFRDLKYFREAYSDLMRER